MCLWSNTIVWFSSISVWVLLGEPSLKWLYPLQWTHTLMHLGLPVCAGLSRLLEDCPQTVVPCFIISCWLLMKYWDHTQLMSGTGLYQEAGEVLTSASEPHGWSVCCVGLKVWCFHCQYSSVLLLGAKILELFIPALCKNNYTLFICPEVGVTFPVPGRGRIDGSHGYSVVHESTSLDAGLPFPFQPVKLATYTSFCVNGQFPFMLGVCRLCLFSFSWQQ